MNILSKLEELEAKNEWARKRVFELERERDDARADLRRT